MIKRGLVLVVAVAASGCTVMGMDSRIDEASKSTDAMRELVSRNATTGGIERTKRPRLAGEEVDVRSNALPAMFASSASYVTKGSQSLLQVLEDISAITGMPVRTGEIAQAGRQSGGFAQMPQQGSDSLTGNVNIEYHGTARGLFDEIAAKANVSWRYNASAKSVEFFRYEMRTLPVHVPAGAKTVAASISLSGVSGGGGGGSSSPGSGGGGSGSSSAGNVSVSQSLNIDPWSSIMDGVRAILGDDKKGGNNVAAAAAVGPAQGAATGGASGGGVAGASSAEGSAIANPDLGFITVVARPSSMARIARYVDSINERFAKNVLIDVKLYSVTLSKQSSLGFNLNMLYSSMNKYGVSVNGPGALQPGSASPGVLTVSSKDPSSRWVDSSVVAQALEQYGSVSLTMQKQILAVNGQPGSIQIADKVTYKSGNTVIPQSGNQAPIVATTQGTEVVGFTGNFIPLILGDNRISLDYQMNISALSQPLTPDAQGVVSPRISTQSLPGHAFVRDGQAIVLFGSDDQREGIDSALHIAGASKAGTKERTMLVVVVQVSTGAKNEDI